MAVKASGSITLAVVVDVASVARYYRLQSSTLAKPAKPTANPPSGWTATEPAYTAGATNSLYTCELTVLSDNTWSYSDVSLSSSYEAAKQAYNAAQAAQDAAGDALNKTLYAACNTASATAAKVPSSTVAGFSLVAGASLRVKFTYANTAASPTLNVNSTGAKQIRLNGANSAYWTAGATVDMVYDGAYWQVCNTPLYGITATVGNPAGGNVYVDGEGVSVRSGSTVLARLKAGVLELAANSVDAIIRLCGGKGMIGYYADTDQLAVMAPTSIALTTCTTLPDGTVQPNDAGVACNSHGVLAKGDVQVWGSLALNGAAVKKEWSGSAVVNFAGGETVAVWDNATIRQMFPGCGDYPCVTFSNGDNSNGSWTIYGALQHGGAISAGGAVLAQASRPVTGYARLNYKVTEAG